MFTPFINEQFGFTILSDNLANPWAAYPISMAITAGTMVLLSLYWGWESRGTQMGEDHREDSPWLSSSLVEVQQLEKAEPEHRASSRIPVALAILVATVGLYLSFVAFW